MGSLQLDCPLCCTETFNCPQSVKYHLLSIIDNILCPSCGSRFQTILELADHLDNECCKTPKRCAPDSNEFNIVNIRIENEDSVDNSINHCILAKTLLSPQSTGKNAVFIATDSNHKSDALTNEYEERYSVQEENEEAMQTEAAGQENSNAGYEEQEVYSCLSCGTNFISIVDHIQEYHEGEEVEMLENEQVELKQDLKANTEMLRNLPESATMISEDGVIIATNDDDKMTSKECQEILEMGCRVRMPKHLNTFKQEVCVDKDGRLYIRKIVQIEKFWDEDSIKPRIPIVLKYVVNNEGALTKITSKDLTTRSKLWKYSSAVRATFNSPNENTTMHIFAIRK